MYGVVLYSIATVIYFLSYVLKFLPAAGRDVLMHDFSLTLSQIGLFISLYTYLYALMQVFVGQLVDKKGLYYTLLVSSLLCGVGSVLESLGSFTYLILGRAFMSVGASFSIVNATKIISLFFEEKHKSLSFGLFLSSGMLGGICGTGLAQRLLKLFTWNQISFGLFSIFMLISVFIAYYVYDYRDHCSNNIKETENNEGFITSLKAVSTSYMIKMSIFSGAGFLVPIVLSTWSQEFIAINNSLSIDSAADILSILFIGVIFGSPFFAYVSSTFIKSNKMYNLFIYTLCIGMMSLLGYISMFSSISKMSLSFIMFIIGSLSAGTFVSFAHARESVHVKYVGLGIGFMNAINSFLEAFAVSLCGILIQLFDGSFTSSSGIISIFVGIVCTLLALFTWPGPYCKIK